MRILKQALMVVLIAVLFCACSGTTEPENWGTHAAAARGMGKSGTGLRHSPADVQTGFALREDFAGAISEEPDGERSAEEDGRPEYQGGSSSEQLEIAMDEIGSSAVSSEPGGEAGDGASGGEEVELPDGDAEDPQGVDWGAEFKLVESVEEYEMISRQRKLAAVREIVRSGSGERWNSDLKNALVAGMEIEISNEIKVFANESEAPSEIPLSVEVAILLYHNLAEEENGSMTVSAGTFESHMNAIRSEGYTAVSFEELVAYVENGAALPERPVVISFDDGYISNYKIAYPFLSGIGMKAVIFPIGVTMGQSTYKDTGVGITPHFGTEEIRLMADSGLVSIQSHTFDMHRTTELDWDYRLGSTRNAGESMEEYERAFREDFYRSKELLEQASGHPVIAYSYPYGHHSEDSERWLADMGVKVTVTTDQRKNIVERGNSDSLRLMGRFTITEEFSKSDLLELLGS